MSDQDLQRPLDGETLRTLPSRLEILRRRKHELIDVSGYLLKELAQMTGKRHDRKFGVAWTLPVLTDWIAEQSTHANWVLQPGRPRHMDRKFNEVIGLVGGQQSHMIRIVSDGRYVHTYPI